MSHEPYYFSFFLNYCNREMKKIIFLKVRKQFYLHKSLCENQE